MEKLLYTKAECEFYTTPLGFNYCLGINKYDKATLRNKVVLKVSLAESICRKYYLTESNIGSSDFLMLVLTGFPLEKSISENLKLLYQNDVKFRRYLSSVYYSKFATVERDCTFLEIIKEDLERFLREEMSILASSLTGSYSIMYNNRTGTDVWFSVDESVSQVIGVIGDYEVEVVSNAKNWLGRVQRNN